MNSLDSLRAAHEALALKAWDTNRARAATLASFIAEVDRTGVCPADQREQARVVAHSLRGSAGTFGHEEASVAAEDLERLLAAPETEVGPALVPTLQGLLARIEAGLAAEPVLDY